MIGGVVHLGVLFSVMGLAASIVMMLQYRTRSAFVFRHAKQAALWQIALLVVQMVWGLMVGGLSGAFQATRLYFMITIPMLFNNNAAAQTLGLVAWVMYILALRALVNGWAGRPYRYPLLGRLADAD